MRRRDDVHGDAGRPCPRPTTATTTPDTVVRALLDEACVHVHYHCGPRTAHATVPRHEYLAPPYDALGIGDGGAGATMWLGDMWVDWCVPCGVVLDRHALRALGQAPDAHDGAAGEAAGGLPLPIAIDVAPPGAPGPPSRPMDPTSKDARFVVPYDGLMHPQRHWAKQACYIMHGSTNAVERHGVGGGVVDASVDPPALRHCPIAVHAVSAASAVATVYIRRHPPHDTATTLGEFLAAHVPGGGGAGCGGVRVQGIAPPPEATMAWLHRTMRHADGWLHVTVRRG